MNIVVLSGNLVRDLDFRTTTTGKSVANGTIAVYRTKEIADFINFQVWERNAENMNKSCRKGDHVMISGAWRKDSYEKDGKTMYKEYCVVNNFDRLTKNIRSIEENGFTSDPDFEETDFVQRELGEALDEDLPF